MHGTMMDFPLTIPAVLERARRPFAATEIVWRQCDKKVARYTFAEFYKRSRALAEALTRAGLTKGDRVATLMWNHASHVEAYFGIPCAGGVLHTLNLRLHPDDIAYIANHAQDRFLIVDDILLPLYEKFRDKMKFERVFVNATGGGTAIPSDYERYEDLLATATGEWDYPAINENDAMGMCYTSGTTGRPKGVVYSHRSTCLHSFAVCLADGLALSGGDTVLPVVPQFHVNAWGIPFAAVLTGAKMVLPGPHLDAANLLELFEQERVTLAAGVPTIWMAILDSLEKNPGARKLMPGMRMVVGGSAAPESMIRAFDRHGMKVIHAWGMTETSPLGTVANVRANRDRTEDETYALRAKQGVAAPFVQVRAADDKGEVEWDGRSPGELQIRGPWVAARYYHQPDASDRWTDDGWFRTGDVVTIDPEGYVKITDRTKDLIKSGGEWISSVDLENALMGHPAIKEAAVIAIAHPKWTERPLAVVVLRENASATPDELRAFLGAKFAKFWLPDGYAFVETIPRTSAGKFLKSALREQFAEWQWE